MPTRDPVTHRDPGVTQSPRDPVTHPRRGVTRGHTSEHTPTVTPSREENPMPEQDLKALVFSPHDRWISRRLRLRVSAEGWPTHRAKARKAKGSRRRRQVQA